MFESKDHTLSYISFLDYFDNHCYDPKLSNRQVEQIEEQFDQGLHCLLLHLHHWEVHISHHGRIS